MIGRYTTPGVYRELFQQRDFFITLAGGLPALLSYLVDRGNPQPTQVAVLLALVSVAVNGFPIVWGALKGLANKEVNVDELVSLAIVASLIQGEFLAAAVVSFVMTLGGLIEEATSDSARKAIKALARITPQTATVLTDAGERTVGIESVAVGDRIRVRPGEQVPVDACILTGISAVDESAMTGESIPVEKKPGDTILAGTLNLSGALQAETTSVGRDTTLGKIIQLVSEAEQHRPEAVRLIDRYAAWFTPVILACAAATWLITGDGSRAIAVLIVGCPCALILAAPTATVAALGRAAKAGVLVKGGQYLERISAVQAVCFDKTGTLTTGHPQVETVKSAQGVSITEVLSLAAAAEQNCTHPLARAVVEHARTEQVPLPSVEEMIHQVGLGVEATVDGDQILVQGISGTNHRQSLPVELATAAQQAMDQGATPLVVYRNQAVIGLITVSDHIRPEAVQAVRQFRELGITRTAILSGDHDKAVSRVAKSVGVEKGYAALKPDDKVKVIRQYQERQTPVLFVGDGINDAPGLGTAHVGAAMGAAGTDIALETADIALTHDDITRLPWLIRLSRRMLLIIKINIVFGLAFNAAAVVLSGAGLLSPILAAIVHNVGSILVVIASASLAVFPDGESRHAEPEPEVSPVIRSTV